MLKIFEKTKIAFVKLTTIHCHRFELCKSIVNPQPKEVEKEQKVSKYLKKTNKTIKVDEITDINILKNLSWSSKNCPIYISA